MTSVVLDGRSLTPDQVCAVSEGAPVEIAPEADAVIRRARAVVDRYVDEEIPAYGVNTGLGVRATEALPRDQLAGFSIAMVRGRSQGWGDILAAGEVRAVVLARLNTLLTGEAGASPHVAGFLADALNRNLLPAMRRTASIGAGDLVASAAMAHAFIGEGEMLGPQGLTLARQALAEAGMEPLVLGPKDGLILSNNTCFSTGLAALAVCSARRALDGLFSAAALSLEGFRGNVSPLETADIRPQPGHAVAARRLLKMLDGGSLRNGDARRLQDPVSFRALAQGLGTALAELELTEEAVRVELNHSGDNPVVQVDQNRLVSTANFHLTWLSARLDSLARALAWVATDSVSRVHRFMTPGVSGLPPLLSSAQTARAGFGPLLKPAEAIRAEIIHLAQPVPILPSHNADGIEDALTLAPQAAMKLQALTDKLNLLIAFELAAGAQALDLAGPERVAPAVEAIHRGVRAHLPFIDEDRPVGRAIEAIASAVSDGDLVPARAGGTCI